MRQDIVSTVVVGRHRDAGFGHRMDFESRVWRREVLFIHVDVGLLRVVDDQQFHFIHVHRVP